MVVAWPGKKVKVLWTNMVFAQHSRPQHALTHLNMDPNDMLSAVTASLSCCLTAAVQSSGETGGPVVTAGPPLPCSPPADSSRTSVISPARPALQGTRLNPTGCCSV